METHKVTCRNGQFYNTEGFRLIFSENKLFEITGDKNTFSTHDPFLDAPPPKTPLKMKEWAESKFGEEYVIKILSAETPFVFSAGLGTKRKGTKESRFKFEGLFEEDVYMRLVNKNEPDVPESWNIIKCVSRINNCSSHNFNLPQIIRAETPAETFSKLIGNHFPGQRGTGISIYNYFYSPFSVKDSLIPHEEWFTLGEIRKRILSVNKKQIAKLKARLLIKKLDIKSNE